MCSAGGCLGNKVKDLKFIVTKVTSGTKATDPKSRVQVFGFRV